MWPETGIVRTTSDPASSMFKQFFSRPEWCRSRTALLAHAACRTQQVSWVAATQEKISNSTTQGTLMAQETFWHRCEISALAASGLCRPGPLQGCWHHFKFCKAAKQTYVYIYIYTYVCMCIYIYIYIILKNIEWVVSMQSPVAFTVEISNLLEGQSSLCPSCFQLNYVPSDHSMGL